MDHAELRHHIEATDSRGRLETRLLTARLAGFCWPGGAADRSDRAALNWVRRWRPERLGASLPACSCATGRCTVCN